MSVAIRHWLDFLTSSKCERAFRILFLLAVIYAVLGGVVLRLWAPIIIKHDNAFFMPLVFAIRNGLGLTNPWISPTGSTILDWHGIVHPLLSSWLAPTASWASVNAATVFIAAAGLAVHFFLIWRTNSPMIVKSLAALILPPAYMGFSGRPETTATLLIAALIAVNFLRAPFGPGHWPRLLASGAILGVLGAAHPFAAGVTAVAYCTYLALEGAKAHKAPSSYMICVVATGLTALAFLVLVFAAFYPYSLQDWINGVFLRIETMSAHQGNEPFLKYYLATKHTPFLVLTFLPFLYLMYLSARPAWPVATLFYKIVLGLGGLLFLVLFIRFPLVKPASYYNYTVFLPALAVGLCLTVKQREIGSWPGRLIALCLTGFIGFCYAAEALWVYQSVAGATVRHGQKQEIAAIVTKYVKAGRTVAMDGPLFVAIDDLKTALALKILTYGDNPNGSKVSPPAESLDVVLRAQAEFATPAPELPGFALVKNAFLKGHGAVSFSRPEHLGYAVYFSRKRQAQAVPSSGSGSPAADRTAPQTPARP